MNLNLALKFQDRKDTLNDMVGYTDCYLIKSKHDLKLTVKYDVILIGDTIGRSSKLKAVAVSSKLEI